MKKLIDKDKKYGFWDFLRIPFQVCFTYTGIKAVNKIISALIPSVQVLITAKFIDTAISIFNGQTSEGDIKKPLLLLMLIVAYGYLNSQFMSYINLRFDMQMTRVYRSAIVEKRAKLSYEHIENNDSWDLITRTCGNPVGKITSGLNNILGALEIILRVTSILMIVMVQVWWAGLAIVGICIPLCFLAVRAGKETYKANKEAEKHKRRAGYYQKVLQDRDNIEERTFFGYSDHVNTQWYEKYETARKINQKVLTKHFIRMKGSSLITVFISFLIIFILLFPLSRGTITVGMFTGLVTGILGLIQMMSWQLSYIINELTGNKEYLKDLTTFCQLSETEGALDLPVRSKELLFEHLEFINVSFKYPGTDKYILKDFNLKLKKNMHYAFVGVNGAGKTTITKLLTGMYNNYEGEIMLNGKELRQYTQAQLKGMFSVVYQDFAKYYISLKDNIALGNPLEKDERAIEKSISLIGLDKTVANLKDRMDTYLGKIKENGVDISGGEWQRVAIARVLYNPASMRILDEPTAALDPVAESEMYEMFGRISAGKSTIFITHRLGAARLADEIIVIHQGKVKEQGSHEDLLEQGGIYAEMFETQRSWYV